MKLRTWFWQILLIFGLLGMVAACSKNTGGSHKKPHGKLKKGGRIPCPIKDC
jgi:hypothetical protein